MKDDDYTSAKTSNADKVIDALTAVSPDTAPRYVCSDCGNTAYTTRRPLGGPKIKVCTQCNSKRYSTHSAPTAMMHHNLHHGQGQGRGPTAKTLSKSSSKPNKDKHQPTFKRKGKKL